MNSRNKRFLYLFLSVPILLLIPLLAMAFSNEVNWSTADFLVMGSLLSFLVIGIEITLRLVSTLKGKLAVIAILIALFLLVWAELSVGVFGSPFAGS